jgi:flavin reductase (DIM6/NTAB) family NADH-FMN oxidoreductase RutF
MRKCQCLQAFMLGVEIQLQILGLIGTKSIEGKSNLAIFNSLIHIGANPALYGILFRPSTVPRHTLQNIIDTNSYTINFVSSIFSKKAHQTSAKYLDSEFSAVGFEEQYVEGCFAPFVKESVIKVEMSFVQKVDIILNGTSLVIGSIERILLEEELLGKDGFVDHHHNATLIACGLDAYYDANFIGRYEYAKPIPP